jgi:ElaB/YqjD/DUF883 family membrane-anchored ribosome-binding protein
MATNSNAEQDIQSVKDDLRDLRKDVSDLAGALKRLAVDESRAGYQKLKKGASEIEHQIEERPFASVGIALGVGFIVGLLLDRHYR